MKKFFTIVTIAACVALSGEVHAKNFISSTEHDPVLISRKREVAIGKNTDSQMRQTYKLSTDQRLNQQINDIGQRLAVLSKRNNLKYTFTVLDDELVNAFAAPGGYIYITKGIMNLPAAELRGIRGIRPYNWPPHPALSREGRGNIVTPQQATGNR